MPRFDGTGPKGTGSQTGRKNGKCQSGKSDNSEGQLFGLGKKRGKGRRCQNTEGGRGKGQGCNRAF